MIDHGNIMFGMSQKTRCRAHLRPPEASEGQTRQTIVGTKVALGKLEQIRIGVRNLGTRWGSGRLSSGYTNSKSGTKTVFSFSLEESCAECRRHANTTRYRCYVCACVKSQHIGNKKKEPILLADLN